MRLLLALLFVFAFPAAFAQDVRWERVGEAFSAQALDVADDGTLYATGSAGVLRLVPEDTWEVVDDIYAYDIIVLGAGDTLVVEERGILRSTNGGQTWTKVYDKTGGTLERLSDGTLFSGLVHFTPSGFSIRSDDAGATWEAIDFPEAALLNCGAFGEAGGNVLAGCAGGIGYSTDGGRSFVPSSLWLDRVYQGRSFAQLSDGTALALVGGGCCHGGIYRSRDGGRTWDFLFDIAGPGTLAAAGQTVFAVRADSRVWRSTDGGQAWEEVAPVYEGEAYFRARDAAVGPDGQLYVAGNVAGPPAAPSGVYRTVEPVFPVAAETALPQRVGTRLEVYPNPALGSVTVPLVVAQPGAVRVAVYDVLGREVAVLHEGPLAPGEHAFRLDASALPAGAYIARVTSPSGAATAPVTIVR